MPGPGQPPADDGKTSLLGYLLSIAHTAMEAHDRMYVEQADYARMIPINTLGVQTTQFSIDDDPELKQRPYDSSSLARVFLTRFDPRAQAITDQVKKVMAPTKD